MDSSNQLMLFQKCIGLGTFDYSSTCSDMTGRYIACCLRGGTMYLVPVVENDVTRNDVTMLTIPLDSGNDGLVRLVQSFTAGMAKVRHRKEENKECVKSVAMIGWQEGIIDVYDVCPG